MLTEDASANIVPIGEPCKNNACQVTFRDETSMSEVCWHHPGAPIFHEGMKYWSCCQKKTSEFDSFMSQAGCTRGKHAWTKEVKWVFPCLVLLGQWRLGYNLILPLPFVRLATLFTTLEITQEFLLLLSHCHKFYVIFFFTALNLLFISKSVTARPFKFTIKVKNYQKKKNEKIILNILVHVLIFARGPVKKSPL